MLLCFQMPSSVKGLLLPAQLHPGFGPSPEGWPAASATQDVVIAPAREHLVRLAGQHPIPIPDMKQLLDLEMALMVRLVHPPSLSELQDH